MCRCVTCRVIPTVGSIVRFPRRFRAGHGLGATTPFQLFRTPLVFSHLLFLKFSRSFSSSLHYFSIGVFSLYRCFPYSVFLAFPRSPVFDPVYFFITFLTLSIFISLAFNFFSMVKSADAQKFRRRQRAIEMGPAADVRRNWELGNG